MVHWLRPTFLIRAGLEVAISGLFARFVDKREVEAGLPLEYLDVSDRDEDGAFWIDYVADVGEGFHSTYTVARLLAERSRTFEWDGERFETKRGRLLILGGDQVYPSAGWKAYRDRFVGPYRAAYPYTPDDEEPPHLYAIPGNHDWYDGLTSFMRLFCQDAWIGGWKTKQHRSYFALRLPQRWWLWATDIQFDTYMDGPQLSYFRNASALLRPGDRVIIATAKPSWVDAEAPSAELMKEGSWEALSYLEEQLVEARGATVAVTLSGDKHHYARYHRDEPGSPQERITAGGGGAHTSTTHGLPSSLSLAGAGAGAPVGYTRKGVSPTPDQSVAMRNTVFRGVARVHRLGFLIGGIYGLLAVLLAAGLKDQDTGLQSSLVDRSAWAIFWDAVTVWNLLLVAALVVGLWAFASAEKGPWLSAGLRRWVFGGLHTAAHVVPAVGLTLLGLWLLRNWDCPAQDGMVLGWIVAGGLFVVGFTLGRLVFALYLWLANVNDGRQHATEICGAIASTDYKNFLRLRLGPDGDLTIYPVGIRSCPHWELPPTNAPETGPWFVPAPGQGEPEPTLIEPPIPIPHEGS